MNGYLPAILLMLLIPPFGLLVLLAYVLARSNGDGHRARW
jgi:hypothetical protein